MDPNRTPPQLWTPPQQRMQAPSIVREAGRLRSTVPLATPVAPIALDFGPEEINLPVIPRLPLNQRPPLFTPGAADFSIPRLATRIQLSPPAPKKEIDWAGCNRRILRAACRFGDMDSLRQMNFTLVDILHGRCEILKLAADNGQGDVLRYLKGFGLTADDARIDGNACLKMATYGGFSLAVLALRGYGLTYADATMGEDSAYAMATRDGATDMTEIFDSWLAEESELTCDGETQSCALCLQNFLQRQESRGVKAVTLAVTLCRHVFHRACLMGWMEQNMTCPMCRAKLDPTQAFYEVDIAGGTAEAVACAKLLEAMSQPRQVMMLE